MLLIKKIVFTFLFFFVSLVGYAQCAMCKAVVESDLDGGGTIAKGINDGIIYLMIIPYVLIGGVGFFIYRHYKKNKASI